MKKRREAEKIKERESESMKKSKKKVVLIVLGIVLALIIIVAVVAYAVLHGLYKSSNYVKDENVKQQYQEQLKKGDEAPLETIDPEEAEGKKIDESEAEEIEKQRKEFSENEPITTDGKVYNVLLIGVDRRDDSWAGNSDTMILLSINEKKKQISMVSLMRDTYADIPGIGLRKLNAAHANGAGPLLTETVTENFKVQVDRYITVDFNNMIDIINMVGPITINMSDDEVKVANDYLREMCTLRKEDLDDHLIKKGGDVVCDGMRAVAYARIRYVGNADYQRTERQRLVLSKLMEELKAMSLTDLYGLADDLLPMVTHNVPEDEILGLLLKSPDLFKYKIVQDRIPYDGMFNVIYVNGQDMLVPDWDDTVERLKETLY